MRRTRKRPLPAHLVEPDSALAFGFVLGAISFFFLSITVNVLAASLALSAIAFYVFVYTMWLKRTSVAEHRDRRGRRRRPGPGRLGGGHGDGRTRGVGAVRDRLRLDAAALLGARDAVQRGLPRGRDPDAAGRPGTAGDPEADPPVLAGAVRDVPAARAGRLDGSRVRGRGRRARRVVRLARAPAVARDVPGRVDAPVPLLDRLPRPALRRGRRRRPRSADAYEPGSPAHAGRAVRTSRRPSWRRSG